MGYCLISYGLCFPLKLIWADEILKGHRGPVITSQIFEMLMWVVIGLWHAIVGHGLCAEKSDEQEEGNEKREEEEGRGQQVSSGCCGSKPRYKQQPFYPGYGAAPPAAGAH